METVQIIQNTIKPNFLKINIFILKYHEFAVQQFHKISFIFSTKQIEEITVNIHSVITT